MHMNTLLLPNETSASLVNAVHHADIFDLCERVYRAGLRVDMILCDLPYGTTACAWDTVIPFAPMWAAFKRIIKPRGAIVLTASEPFSFVLGVSNLPMFRYSWVWRKNRGSNPTNAHIQPMKEHESVLIFGGDIYNPQMKPRSEGGRSRAAYAVNPSNTGKRQVMGGFIDSKIQVLDPNERLPGSVLDFNTEVGLHPTQKPVDLFRYLIRTYTRPCELVFDPCCGSGTTAIAAREEGRRFIVGDSSAEYVSVTQRRLDAPYTPSFLPALDASA